MITVWRISKAGYTRQAFSGLGAQRFGGRWNSKSFAVVYTSETLALAVLEILVHLPRPRHLKTQRAAAVDVPETLVQAVGRLPKGWRQSIRTTQHVGDQWLKDQSAPVLAVPSAVFRCGDVQPMNYLLNPNHPAFSRLRMGSFNLLSMDPRIS